MKTKSNVSKQGTSCVANMESVAVSVGNEPTELPVAKYVGPEEEDETPIGAPATFETEED
jgi:hypothetical protein